MTGRGSRDLLDRAFLSEILNREDEIEQLYSEILAGSGRDAEHADKIRALEGLARFCSSQGRPGDAFAYHTDVLAFKEEEGGPDVLQLVPTLRRLAASQLQLGDSNEAATDLERALAIIDRSEETDSFDRIETLMSLGSTLVRLGRPQHARDRLEEALALQESALGPSHHSVATTLVGLADLAKREGDLDAQELYERAVAALQCALQLQERAVGSEHASVVRSVDRIARLHVQYGGYEEAARLYQRLLTTKEHLYGVDHPSTLATVVNLARTFTHQRQDERAEALFERAVKAQEESSDPGDRPRLAGTLTYWGYLRRMQGRQRDEKELLERADRLRHSPLPSEVSPAPADQTEGSGSFHSESG